MAASGSAASEVSCGEDHLPPPTAINSSGCSALSHPVSDYSAPRTHGLRRDVSSNRGRQFIPEIPHRFVTAPSHAASPPVPWAQTTSPALRTSKLHTPQAEHPPPAKRNHDPHPRWRISRRDAPEVEATALLAVGTGRPGVDAAPSGIGSGGSDSQGRVRAGADLDGESCR
jgi:hypothetical protein